MSRLVAPAERVLLASTCVATDSPIAPRALALALSTQLSGLGMKRLNVPVPMPVPLPGAHRSQL